MHEQTEERSRPSLTPSQDFRVRIAGHDLERVRSLDLATISNATLLLEVGALTSSLYSVIGVLKEVAEVHP